MTFTLLHEESVKLYAQEIFNVDSSSIRVVKLVLRGRNLGYLSIIFYKVCVRGTGQKVLLLEYLTTTKKPITNSSSDAVVETQL